MSHSTFTRRRALKGLAAGAAAGALGFPAIVRAQAAKIKIGLMLPYSGTFAIYGESITNAFTLALQDHAKALGGREIEYVRLDDESDPSKATDNINRMVTRDKVDVVIGTVHSGVAAGMLRVTKSPASLSNRRAASASNALMLGSSPETSSPTWAFFIASRIAGLG